MIVYEWNESVNSNFYSGTNGFLENAVEQSFMSGRKIAWLSNERFQETKSLNLMLENTVEKPEYKTFKEWFKAIGGTTNAFHCPALDEGEVQKKWRFSSYPTEDSGQKYKVLTINIEEVY